MDSQHRKIIITIILIIIFILAWVRTIKLIQIRSKGALQIPSTSSDTLQNLPKEEIWKNKLTTSGEKIRQLSWSRCPFSGAIYVERDEEVNFKLTGIIWDEKFPQALINGKILQEGDSINQFKIKKIYKDKIQLESADKILEIKLGR